MTDEHEFRDPGPVPDLDWIAPDLLDVDEAYQRAADQGRVDKIVTWFDWRSFGALVVTPAGEGRFHVVDGQHRALAAKAHPDIQFVPCVIIKADDTAAEAESFLGLNSERRNITSLDAFWARIAARDPDAERVADLAGGAGLRLCRYPSSRGEYQPADSIAVGSIAALQQKHGDRLTAEILIQLAKGKLAPITSQHIRAAEALLTDEEFGDMDPQTLWLAVDGCRPSLDAEAKEFAATHRVPIWRAMASIWFRKARKRRRQAV